ncbi:MAG: cation:proton antiporter [Candidatus Altiarchaeota archaeon]
MQDYTNPLWVVLLILFSAIFSFEFHIAVPIFEVFSGIIGKNLFSLEFSSSFKYLSFLGLVSLMYLTGLEIDLKLMRENFRRAFALGALTFFGPFILILASTFALLSFSLEKAVITGICLSMTSLAIVYPILKESGFLKTNVGKVILGAVAFSEIFGMLILSLMFFKFSLISFTVIAIFLISISLLPDISNAIIKRYRNHSSEIELKFILVLLLGISTISEFANIEVAISSFFIGVVTSKVIKDHEDLEKKLRNLTFGFLTPFFFFEIGMNIGIMQVTQNLFLVISLFFISYSANFICNFIFGKKFTPTHAKYVTYLFNIPLPISLIAAVLAVEAKIYDSVMYSIIAIVTLISSVVSSFMIGRKRCGLDMVCDQY